MFDFSIITIGDTKYTLKFPLSAMLKAERLLSRPLQEIFTPKDQNAILNCKLSDLVVLFRIGIHEEHKELTDQGADDLFMQFLQEGKTILEQESLLYILLGRALGFFRTAVDSEGRSMKTQEEKTE